MNSQNITIELVTSFNKIMRIIDPNYFDKEKRLFEQELSDKPNSFYKEQEFQNVVVLHNFLYNIGSESGFKDVVLKINPFTKMISAPFVFMHPEENKLRGPSYREIVLRRTFFTTEGCLMHYYKLGKEVNFFKSLLNYKRSFTINSLLKNVEARVTAENIKEIEQSFLEYTKSLLLEQIFIIDNELKK